ncbi:acyl-CoA dehydrogenase [Nakamurella sp. YIM 132087]|uniref:Acyl-CoA dehydrogenase n=1 Tax=Nakamurella alba TaxID=2665158 RepID=A0A7K1FKT7_9ACTN|nr:acyl-CoA dehydrogenase family protein [Nakamurella alba]MTD14767.1 acyl-CoA dehydrogenase [Nakamurella alba]
MAIREVLRERAHALAHDLLFPSAAAVDAADRLPDEHWSALAGAGLLALAADSDDLGPESFALAGDVLASLAGGCLSTGFLWIQHEGTAMAVARSSLRDRYLPGLVDGSVRSGIALGGLRPGPDQLRVRAVDGGFVLDGSVPWVSGWGMLDVLQVAAVCGDEVVFLLIDAVPSDGLTGTLLSLVAAQASRTVTLHCAGLFVPGDRELARMPLDDWNEMQRWGSPLNGFLALGVAGRCALLLGDEAGDLPDAIVRTRADLLAADPPAVPAARAAASVLADRAAARLAVRTGAASVLRGSDAERLRREAGFLLVFASRPLIRAETMDRLG